MELMTIDPRRERWNVPMSRLQSRGLLTPGDQPMRRLSRSSLPDAP